MQKTYDELKKKHLFHDKIIEHFEFIPIFTSEINCFKNEIQKTDELDFHLRTLEPAVKEAFSTTQAFNIANVGSMLDLTFEEFGASEISDEKNLYYEKLADLASFRALIQEGKEVSQEFSD